MTVWSEYGGLGNWLTLVDRLSHLTTHFMQNTFEYGTVFTHGTCKFPALPKIVSILDFMEYYNIQNTFDYINIASEVGGLNIACL